MKKKKRPHGACELLDCESIRPALSPWVFISLFSKKKRKKEEKRKKNRHKINRIASVYTASAQHLLELLGRKIT